jgi:hypothetical protein
MNILEVLLIGKIGQEARPKFHLLFFTFKPQKTFIEGGRKGGTHVEFLFWGRRTKEAISS